MKSNDKIKTSTIIKPVTAIATLIGGIALAFRAVKFIVNLDKKESKEK